MTGMCGRSVFRNAQLPAGIMAGVVAGFFFLGAVVHAHAATFGLLADNAGNQVSLFDPASDSVHWTAPAGMSGTLGDCAISSDEHLAVSSNSSGELAFLDPRAVVGARGLLAPVVTSRLTLSNRGVDLAISPDNHHLVTVGGGSLSQPLVVVDLESRSEIATPAEFQDHTSAEFCDDGTLLLTTTTGSSYGPAPDNALYDARLDAVGQLGLLGNRLTSNAMPNNTACAPGSRSGVLLDRAGGLTAFRVPGLEPTDHAALEGATAISAAFSANGLSVFVRTERTVEAFDFEPRAGRLEKIWVRPAATASTYYGMDQLAVHPESGKLYVNGGSELLVLDPVTGAATRRIAAGDSTGVCFAAFARQPVRQVAAGGGESAPFVTAP